MLKVLSTTVQSAQECAYNKSQRRKNKGEQGRKRREGGKKKEKRKENSKIKFMFHFQESEGKNANLDPFLQEY